MPILKKPLIAPPCVDFSTESSSLWRTISYTSPRFRVTTKIYNKQMEI